MPAASLDPVPPATLVEDDVARDAHALRLGVEDAVRLGAISLADEDAGAAVIIELLELRQILGVGDVAERAQVLHLRRLAVPGLVRRIDGNG